MSAVLEIEKPEFEPADAATARPVVPKIPLTAIAVGVLLAVAIFFRVWQLGRTPGVNGDEAWTGVNAQLWLRGEDVPWRTPTGNLINPFLFWPQVALHAVFPPSFTLLRVPAVVSGLLALWANFYFCRRVFGRRTAWISTLILAVLPINIAYSRFAWDACQSLLASVPMVYLPLLALHDPHRRTRWTLLAVLALGAAVLVHPTNVFLAPLLTLPWLAAFGDWWKREPRKAAIAAATVVTVGTIATALAFPHVPLLQTAVHRIGSLEGNVEFGENLTGLLTGTTVYQFIPGATGCAAKTAAFFHIGVRLFGLVLLIGLLGRIAASATNSVRSLLLAIAIMVLGFAAVAGPNAISPHFERYGICLVLPITLLLALGGDWLAGRSRSPAASQGVLLCGGMFVLLGFYVQYYCVFERSGGTSHEAFWTGPVEPKQAAVKFLLLRSKGSGERVVIADSWWTYWPIRYLTVGIDRVRVLQADEFRLDKTESNRERSRQYYVWFAPRHSNALPRLPSWFAHEFTVSCGFSSPNLENLLMFSRRKLIRSTKDGRPCRKIEDFVRPESDEFPAE